ncbi:MAG: hypothetical protein M3362_21795, partial [Acidobacteriota bacterium]|nr:hypothetical protein [Acidobacteriota bacterium]
YRLSARMESLELTSGADLKCASRALVFAPSVVSYSILCKLEHPPSGFRVPDRLEQGICQRLE